MQEEVTNKTLSLTISAAKFSGRVLKAAISKYLAHRKEKKLEKSRAPDTTYGRVSMKKLQEQYGDLRSIEVEDKDTRQFERIARKYGVTPTAIAVAWISRHPAKIQTIVGTTNAQRLREICASDAVTLTREEWYELYLAAGKRLP